MADTTTTRSFDDLPTECWETILNLLNHQQKPHHQHNLHPISLLSKKFLSISNDLRSQFTITDRTLHSHNGSVSNLLRRFHNIKRIDFVEFTGDIDRIISEIACSELKIEVLGLSGQKCFPVKGLKNLGVMMKGSLKGLICDKLGFIGNDDLKVISVYFPYLEELDISYPQRDVVSGIIESFVTDDGIKMIAESLLSIKKINISGNNLVTNQSLVAISRNFKGLEEIAFLDCVLVTDLGIFDVIWSSPNLVSLVGNGICLWDREVLNCYSFGKDLRILSFTRMRLAEEFLLSLREANLPLQKFVLRHCKGFTFDMLASLLSKYSSLSYLDLSSTFFLTDHMMESLSRCLPNLAYVGLNFCSKLTISTLFSLARNCTSLEQIEMEGTTSAWEEGSDNCCKKNLSICSLNLAGSKYLDDDCLKKLVSVFPNILSLDISRCSKITNRGVESIGKGCTKIIKLEINGCLCVESIGVFGFSKLEILRAAWSGVDDECLRMIGKRCRQLLCLDLEGCSRVSDKGVKDVVENCKRLRELSLKNCCTVSVDLVTWMVFSRATLTKIIPPRDFVPADKQRDLFLRHGCMVHNG